METVNTITKKVIQVLILLLTFMLIFSLAEFIFLVGRAAIANLAAFSFSNELIDRNKLFFNQVQGLIAAALLLTILIELINSLVEYIKAGHTNYVNVIIEIALIAIVRHLLAIDFEHADATLLLGLSALIFVLGMFFLVSAKRISIFRSQAKKDKQADDKI